MNRRKKLYSNFYIRCSCFRPLLKSSASSFFVQFIMRRPVVRFIKPILNQSLIGDDLLNIYEIRPNSLNVSQTTYPLSLQKTHCFFIASAILNLKIKNYMSKMFFSKRTSTSSGSSIE